MYINQDLQNHLQTASSVEVGSLVLAEINLNSAERIAKIGNYRTADIPSVFDPNDVGNKYTGATDSDIVIDGGFDTSADLPASLVSIQQNKQLLFSLEDCFGKFRPRSGINKAVYYGNTPGHYTHHSYRDMMTRPRYYVPSREDRFKYWTSFRQENGVEKGISKYSPFGNTIEDAAPFVVYNEQLPANRIVIKMQTHVGKGNYDIGYVYNGYEAYPDPFFDEEGVILNRNVPIDWRIEYLDSENNWVALPGLEDGFGNDGYDLLGNPIIPRDGYLELHYGILEGSQIQYGWYVGNSEIRSSTSIVDQLVSPELIDGDKYSQFQMIKGLRIVISTMSKPDIPFELIELSPRLAFNLTDVTTVFTTNKVASDLGVSGLPVGQLLSSVGSIEIADFDQAFNVNNAYDVDTNPNGSIIAKYSDKNIQIKFYEVIKNVNQEDYYVPIKTLYAETFPELNTNSRTVNIGLRDLYFYFESFTAPQLLVRNASLSYAIALLLDSIGFSNYVYKRVPNEEDPIIPFFFIPPDTSVAQVLADLAISTQTAMFFDENNDFVLMSKQYILPEIGDRDTDIDMTLFGSPDLEDQGIVKNATSEGSVSNIIEISSKQNNVFNGGSINYVSRYIQRSIGEIQQSYLLDKDRVWKYKPALLWEVSGSQDTKSQNEVVANQSSYLLTAIPLNSDLTDSVPEVSNGVVINNTMDLGDAIYWIARYNGYLYANSEIIKYDAVEYNVLGIGNVWITSVLEYQNYFSKLPFGGKIYPTGRLRIYSEPYYDANDVIKNGAVAKHGRGQFGTAIAYHTAGLSQYWTNDNNIYGLTMDSDYLFKNKQVGDTEESATGFANGNTVAKQTLRSGIIKNFMATNYYSETEIGTMRTTQPGTIQSSALVMTGNVVDNSINPLNHVSYLYKPLDNKYQHFGTRLRIIGSLENSETKIQTPSGSTYTFTAENATPDNNIAISSASGGIGIMVDPTTNNGYFLELMALTNDNVSDYTNSSDIFNMVFYKVKGASGGTSLDSAIPVPLWSGLSTILCDDGRFTGQYRVTAEQNPTVYDLAVEYENIGTSKKFYIYVNNKLVGTVIDDEPLSENRIYNSMAVFVRGNSKLMFEKVYAIGPNLAQNSVNPSDAPLRAANIFNKETDSDDSFRKYSIGDSIQSTYLSGISPLQPPTYNMYYDEFGTIMREASYFNIRYDKAYPALFAKISPTFNKLKGYAISGFIAGAYGSEFLIFNTTDMPLNLDETSGNYLRIQGVTFTQESEHQFTLDEYFSKKSDFSQTPLSGELEDSPAVAKKTYNDIKNSRLTYGKNEFSLSTPYIQSQDTAADLMAWLSKKVTKPRKSVGVSIFSMPILQLGDIVNFEYLSDGIEQVASSETRFVIYNIDYSRDESGPSMTLYLSEVV